MHYLSKSVMCITIKAVMALKNILHASIFLSIQFHIFCNVFYFPTEPDLLGHLIETKKIKTQEYYGQIVTAAQEKTNILQKSLAG